MNTKYQLISFQAEAYKRSEAFPLGLCSLEYRDSHIMAQYEILPMKRKILWPREVYAKAKQRDLLWQSTCFELFLMPKSHSHYWEWNLSPNGDWACYFFDDYRNKSPLPYKTARPLLIHSKITEEEGLIAKAEVGFQISIKELLKSSPYNRVSNTSTDLAIGLCCVLELESGELIYMALNHPLTNKPDFHNQLGFTATIKI